MYTAVAADAFCLKGEVERLEHKCFEANLFSSGNCFMVHKFIVFIFGKLSVDWLYLYWLVYIVSCEIDCFQLVFIKKGARNKKSVVEQVWTELGF